MDEDLNIEGKNGKIVGGLIITAIVSSLLSGVFSDSINSPDYLTAVSANEDQVLIAVLFQLVLVASVVAIPIVMFPIFRKHSESLALGPLVTGFLRVFTMSNALYLLDGHTVYL